MRIQDRITSEQLSSAMLILSRQNIICFLQQDTEIIFRFISVSYINSVLNMSYSKFCFVFCKMPMDNKCSM